MINYDKVIAFLERENPDVEVVSRFKQAYYTFSKTGEWHQSYQVLTAGWQKTQWSFTDDPRECL